MKIYFIENIKNRIGLYFNSPLHNGKYKDFIFIHINKTGGTSIINIIGKPFRKHLTANQVIQHIGQKKWNNAYKFTVVRNPWDKVVSQYKFRIKTNKSKMTEQRISFKDWVTKVFKEKDSFYYGGRPQMYIPQVEWLKNVEGEIDIDNILRFENITEDYKHMAKLLKINQNLPHLNSTQKSDYRGFYDEETKLIINKWFKEDIKQFGYKF